MSWDRARPLNRIQSANQKVMVLIPHKGESGYPQWERWWKDGLIKPPGTSWLEQRGLSLTTNRTGLVIEALKSDAEYFFFFDDDVIGPSELLVTLLGHRLPISCGIYMTKKRKEERGLSAWMKMGNQNKSIGRLEGKIDGLDTRLHSYEKQLEGFDGRITRMDERINGFVDSLMKKGRRKA